MIISATLTFSILALARAVGDPYWRILLHLQEAGMCFFVFFAVGIFIKTFDRSSSVSKGPHGIVITHVTSGRWKLMLAFLFAFAALSYRYSTYKAFAAVHDNDMSGFNPWLLRGNVFAICSAVLASLIATGKLKSDNTIEKTVAYVAACAALLSLAPLPSPLGISLLHPLTLLFVVLCAAVIFVAASFIKRCWGIL